MTEATAKQTRPGEAGRSIPVGALAVVAGIAVAAGLPPWGWWPLTIIGFALWDHVLSITPTWRRRGALSALAFASWFAPGTIWMFDLTAPGWVIAVVIYSAFYFVVGAVAGHRSVDRRLRFPAAIMIVELVRWTVPFGGVPLATIAMSQVDSPLVWSARLFGTLFLSGATVVAGQALAAGAKREGKAAAIGVAVVVLAIMAGLIGPAASATTQLDVAVVQGGGPQRTRASLCNQRPVFERHMDASATIDRRVDLVLWPEDVVHAEEDDTSRNNYCDEPLLTRSEASERLSELAQRLDATLLPGWFVRSDDGLANLNYTTVITPEGETIDRYDKVRLVPFGEFVPLRSFIERFNDEIANTDVRAGTDIAVLETPVGPIGISISWEIFFDRRAREAIGNGGEILVNPTNGSSYWLRVLQTQQVASSRLRAVETDRWVLQAAPTGFSAIIDNNGAVLDRTGVSEARVLYGTIDRRVGTTLAVRWGPWPAMILAALAIAASVVGPKKMGRQPQLGKHSQ